MSAPRVLVLDDEADLRELLEITLLKMGLDVDSAATLRQARTLFETPEPVSLSIGATLFDQPGVELSHWLKQADEALYTSKRKGRDRMELVPLAPGRPH